MYSDTQSRAKELKGATDDHGGLQWLTEEMRHSSALPPFRCPHDGPTNSPHDVIYLKVLGKQRCPMRTLVDVSRARTRLTPFGETLAGYTYFPSSGKRDDIRVLHDVISPARDCHPCPAALASIFEVGVLLH